MDESSSQSRPEGVAPPNMRQGDTVTDKRQITIVSPDVDSNKTATIHILQHQPTGRPIEDRYSIDIRVCENDGPEAGQTILLLGVYDGHRGSAAAAYVAQALPTEVLSTAAHLSSSDADGQTKLIQQTFERFDQQMTSSFQDAHCIPTKPAAHTPRRILSSIATKISRAKRQKGDGLGDTGSKITAEGTAVALRVLSGCTASMLMIKVPHSCQGTPSADIINLGDSRVVVAFLSPEPTIQATSTDLNSGVKDEQSLIISQHPGDDPKDIFVGGRLFGETLSTRAFGDGIYKLPLRAGQGAAAQNAAGESPKYSELTREERHQHRDLIRQLSAHQQAAAASKGRAKIIPLIDRFDTLFWAYKSPPYVSSTPQVTKVTLDAGISSHKDVLSAEGSRSMVGIVATDGLWDLVSSEEAVEILSQALGQVASPALVDNLNMAQILFDGVTERRGRKPGDDVTILVLALTL